MKKLSVLFVLSLFCFQAFLTCSSPVYAKKSIKPKKYAGQLKGGEAGIGQYLHLGGLDVKVVNWGFVSKIDKTRHYYIIGDNETALQVDILMKNPSDQPLKVWSGIYKCTLIAKDERSYAKYPQFNQYHVPDAPLNTEALPGEPIHASIFFPVDKDMATPAKLVLRAQDNTVARFFLQQNLPEELIPSTTRQYGATAEQPQQHQPAYQQQDNSLGAEIGKDAVDTTKNEIKNKANDTVRENVRNLLKF